MDELRAGTPHQELGVPHAANFATTRPGMLRRRKIIGSAAIEVEIDIINSPNSPPALARGRTRWAGWEKATASIELGSCWARPGLDIEVFLHFKPSANVNERSN